MKEVQSLKNTQLIFRSYCKIWCRRRDSNSHSLRPLPPQDSVSTNSTTTAFLKQGTILALLMRKGKTISNFSIYFGTEDPWLVSPSFATGFAGSATG